VLEWMLHQYGYEGVTVTPSHIPYHPTSTAS
jgi:hypothetical protein